MQIILPAIRGIVLIEDVCMEMGGIQVASHFCNCFKSVSFKSVTPLCSVCLFVRVCVCVFASVCF